MSHPFEGTDGPPNLDCFSIDPDDFEGAADLFVQYATYCRLKGRAMRARLEGSIIGAEALERMLARIYDELPDWAKW